MKIVFHPEITDRQNYTCNCCGRGCRSFLIPVTESERRTIEQLQNWREKLGVSELFLKTRAFPPDNLALAKHPDGQCVFLDNDNLCLIHKQYGLKAKPIACQLYPFIFTPFNGQLRLALRFDCPAVCNADGKTLRSHHAQLKQLAQQLVPPRDLEPCDWSVTPRNKLNPALFDVVNETLLEIATSNVVDFFLRLHWIYQFLTHLTRIKWRNVNEENLPELLTLFKSGTLNELRQKPLQSSTQPLTGKTRKLLSQYFFLLSQPTTVPGGSQQSFTTKLSGRLEKTRYMKQLAQPTAPLPKIHPDWPDCIGSDLDVSFGPFPAEVQELLSRYCTNRVAGLIYCGPNFYNYSLTQGGFSLLLGMATIGWLMRVSARKQNRTCLTLDDAQYALLTFDGNFGYAQPLGQGPAQLRLNTLTPHIPHILNVYCC
jgi:Fe-S-cluster containining protein